MFLDGIVNTLSAVFNDVLTVVIVLCPFDFLLTLKKSQIQVLFCIRADVVHVQDAAQSRQDLLIR